MSKATTASQLRSCASRAQGYAADVARAAAEAIEELEGAKADRTQELQAVIPVAGWSKEEAAPDTGEQVGLPFLYSYDVTAQITASDQADVCILPESMDAAKACGFCTVAQPLEGKIRVRAQLQPGADIRVQCSIQRGATQ